VEEEQRKERGSEVRVGRDGEGGEGTEGGEEKRDARERREEEGKKEGSRGEKREENRVRRQSRGRRASRRGKRKRVARRAGGRGMGRDGGAGPALDPRRTRHAWATWQDGDPRRPAGLALPIVASSTCSRIRDDGEGPCLIADTRRARTNRRERERDVERSSKKLAEADKGPRGRPGGAASYLARGRKMNDRKREETVELDERSGGG